MYAGNNPISYNDPLGDQMSWKRQEWEENAGRGGGGGSPFPWLDYEGYQMGMAGYAGYYGGFGGGGGIGAVPW